MEDKDHIHGENIKELPSFYAGEVLTRLIDEDWKLAMGEWTESNPVPRDHLISRQLGSDKMTDK